MRPWWVVGELISLTTSPIPVGHVRLVHATRITVRGTGPMSRYTRANRDGIADGPPPYAAWIFVQGPARRQSQEMLS